jgi:cell division protein FtsI/penicillin-binding protein 2
MVNQEGTEPNPNKKIYMELKESVNKYITNICRNNNGINSIVSVAQTLMGNYNLQFDFNENLFGCENGVIDLNEEPQLLVVEIVSPSTQVTDYRSKQAEYAVLGISEYWIVDPLQDCVIVCTLVEGWYDQVVFRDEEPLVSQTFSELVLTANQILLGE